MRTPQLPLGCQPRLKQSAFELRSAHRSVAQRSLYPQEVLLVLVGVATGLAIVARSCQPTRLQNPTVQAVRQTTASPLAHAPARPPNRRHQELALCAMELHRWALCRHASRLRQRLGVIKTKAVASISLTLVSKNPFGEIIAGLCLRLRITAHLPTRRSQWNPRVTVARVGNAIPARFVNESPAGIAKTVIDDVACMRRRNKQRQLCLRIPRVRPYSCAAVIRKFFPLFFQDELSHS